MEIVVGMVAVTLIAAAAAGLTGGKSKSKKRRRSSRSVSSYTSAIDNTTSATKDRMDRTSSDYLGDVRDTTRR